MTYIILYSEELQDVADFVDRFKWIVFPKYENQGVGQQTGVFEILIENNQMHLAQVFKENKIEKLLNENKQLKAKNKKLKKRLKEYLPKQDLSVNKKLVDKIISKRRKGMSYDLIAKFLNRKGYKNSRGNKLNSMQVYRLYSRHTKK